ncbi:hypothetical protein ACVC7V_02100 [Hydrogenophaga sp. A37]|uniref:hypothetical protein n=1 Tax=Hydrogenophaga sp. A37 TaxID=1945864 RepID=UPI000986E619|nr:hypothetical protein [Hydrogenophaga sp. A37]OOG82417.1 hypothetical protein B0E41_15320 [Hydrogenophaga sp. A37]
MDLKRFTALALLSLASASALSTEPDAGERKFIRKGMGEGEVVLKIGKPDHEAFHRAVRGHPEEKSWTYFPHARDPQTLTILRFHSGRVAEIERKIAR